MAEGGIRSFFTEFVEAGKKQVIPAADQHHFSVRDQFRLLAGLPKELGAQLTGNTAPPAETQPTGQSQQTKRLLFAQQSRAVQEQQRAISEAYAKQTVGTNTLPNHEIASQPPVLGGRKQLEQKRSGE